MPRRKRKFPLILKIVTIIVALVAIIAGIFGVVMLIRQVTRSASASEIYEKVSAYDYSTGRSSELEQEIKRLLSESKSLEDPTDYATTLKAKAVYYNNIYKYHTALTVLDEYKDYLTTEDDYIFLTEQYAKNYQSLGNEKLAEEYQTEYDNLTHKCGE